MSTDFSAWIGKCVTRHDRVTPRLVEEYRVTLSPFLFEQGKDVAPPGLHFGLAPAMPLVQDTGSDGAERKGVFIPPIALPRRMWAGGSIETFHELAVGVDVSRTSTITDIRFKQGSTGELCLISIQHEISDEQGLAVRERQDLVYRGVPTSPPAPVGPPKETGADWIVDATPLLLFRFSALTFNGHRIHYDLAHAAEEGYPGLLVHGPMQAALMLNLASVRLGKVPQRFDYRCLAQLFSGASFGVDYDAATTTARIIRSDGVVTAEGQAQASAVR